MTYYEAYMNCYKSVISKYPDNYYAYRSYLAMNRSSHALFNATINEAPVVYPYSNLSKNNPIYMLAELKDYDMLDLISDDEFVKSWIYYQKGDYASSARIARDAMDKLETKPGFNDLRWRLVYPVNYFNEIQNYALSNDKVLMLALMREESYFDSNATSNAGAKGLMQIMPATAKDLVGYDVDLYNSEMNIKLGNLYYSSIKKQLNNLDVSAVAAYNGGSGAVSVWKKNLNYGDTDEFIEQIPYSETKNYVKKVFRSYWNYLRIYSE